MSTHVREDPSWNSHWETMKDGMLEQLGDEVLRDAKHFVHVRTGRLRDSLDAEVQNGVLRVGSRDVDYSVEQELGTAHQPPHPYLQPAMYQNRRLR